MDEQKFLMWRTCFAILRLDGVVTKEEMNWADTVIFDEDFTDKQVKVLKEDLQNNGQFDELFSQLKLPHQKAFVLHMVRTLGNIDEDYSEDERLAFKRVEKLVLQNVDLNEIKTEIKEMEDASYTAEVREQHEADKPLLYRGFVKINNAVDDFILYLKNL